MKFFATLTAFVAVAAGAANAATINSPASLIECQPAAITWSDAASGSVYLSVVKGKDISGEALETFPTQSGTSGSYTWKVDQPSGTELTFVVNDSTGKQNYSSQVNVNPGSDTSCLNSNAASSSSGSSGGSSGGVKSPVVSTSNDSGSSSASSQASSPTSSASSSAPGNSANSANSAFSFAAIKGLAVGAAGVVAGLFLA